MTELIVTALAGWALGVSTGAVAGLYFGERGRRKDIAQLTRMQAGDPEPAETSQTYDPVSEAVQAFTEADRNNFVSELVSEGYTEEEANEELDTILTRTHLTHSRSL